MKCKVILWLPLFLFLSLTARGQQFSRTSSRLKTAAPAVDLQKLVNEAAQTTLTRFADKKLTENQLSITLIDLRDPAHPVTASFRGNERIYPASVVKLFYLGAVHRWLEDKKIQETDELK